MELNTTKSVRREFQIKYRRAPLNIEIAHAIDTGEIITYKEMSPIDISTAKFIWPLIKKDARKYEKLKVVAKEKGAVTKVDMCKYIHFMEYPAGHMFVPGIGVMTNDEYDKYLFEKNRQTFKEILAWHEKKNVPLSKEFKELEQRYATE